MPNARLTERFLRDMPAPAQATDYWDTAMPGFAIRSYPSGRKAWLVRWRDDTGRKRFESGGTWPVVKVEQAREWARRILSQAALGLTQAAPTVATVAHLWPQYTARATGGERKNRAAIGKCHVLPALASLPICDIKSGDIDRIVRNLADKPRTGTAVKVHMHGALELARTLNMMPDDRINPASLVRGYPYQPRQRNLSAPEIRRLWQALEQCLAMRVFGLFQAELLQCLLLTGARSGELKSALWSDIDHEHPALVLKAHKTARLGTKRVELGPVAMGILASLPRRNDRIFYGRRAPLSNINYAMNTALHIAGVAHATVHDLRRTFASCALNAGMPIQDVGVLLGHRELSTTGIYALPDIERRQSLIKRAESAVLAMTRAA